MAAPKKRIISRTVWIVSMVSLFTDTASEMLYPVVPVYLQSIGFSIITIGILEGFAEATAGLSKAWFGSISDQSGKRVSFIRTGYVLSAISKPMLAMFSSIWWVFTARATDRLGKGIRTGARDALLKEASTPETKARVFGFHRAMDTVGAFIGPAVALLILHFYPQQYKLLFILAFIPGIAAVLTTFILKEKGQTTIAKTALNKKKFSFFIFWRYWKNSNLSFKKLAGSLIVFALVNSSDVFLLLKAKQILASDTQVIGLYIFYNIVYASFAYPAGMLGDRIGLKKVLLSGILVFALVYVSMIFADNLWQFVIVFGLYGIYASATEGISKAWITHIVPVNETATAVGTIAGFQNLAALLASTLAGLIWFYFKPSGTFLLTAIVAVFVFGYMLVKVKEPSLNPQSST
ncbi:MFS transporter [soil metagenome]